jgi:hypothetical protein
MSDKTTRASKKTADEDGKCYTSTWAIVCYILIGIFFLLALGLLIFGRSKPPASSTPVEMKSV